VNRRVLEALIRSGSLDGLATGRAALLAGLEEALRGGEQSARSSEAGQRDIFGIAAPQPASASASAAAITEWPASVRLAGERETLGLYLTGHPIAPYEPDLRWFATGRIGDYASERPTGSADPARAWAEARNVTLAGLVLELRRRAARVSFLLDDRSGRIEVTLFEEVYQRFRELILKDALVQVEGALRFDEFSDSWRLAARQISPLEQVRERLARSLLLRWPRSACAPELLAALQALLLRHRGGLTTVLLQYRSPVASGVLALGPDWKVRASAALLEQLEHLLGTGAARFGYGEPGVVSSATG
jgi:DNA polymerase-3 subunit alpha